MMTFEDYDNRAILEKLHFEKDVWSTKPWELRYLLWKMRQVPGNIAEIGVFRGEATREFALTYPDRTVYAVDLPPTDIPKFFHEMNETNICAYAKHLPNVKLTLEGRAFAYTPERNIGFVYIDGDHSWEGVRHDTMNALRWFRPGGSYHDRTNARQGIIAWHDYIDSPDFGMKVKPFLDSLALAGWPVVAVQRTSLCYMNL